MNTGVTLTAQGSNGLTAMGAGFVTLVSPVRITTSFVATPVSFGVFGKLTLAYVPEPGPFSLLASGAALILLLGLRRRRATTDATP